MIYALVGILMMAFASCNGTKESKQFQARKAVIQDIEKMIESATKCDDLAMTNYVILDMDTEGEEYTDKDSMTEQESEQIQQMTDELWKKLALKSTELGCNDNTEIDDEGFEIGDEDYDVI